MAPRRRLRRWLARAAWITLAVVAGLVVAVFAVIDTPWVRRAVVAEVNRVLAPQFMGTIRIDALGGLSPFGIRGADVTILDAQGRPVIIARSVAARVDTVAALGSVLFGHGPLTITVPEVSAARIDAEIDKDASGDLGIAKAFAPRQPSPPPAPNEKPGRGLRLVFSRIGLDHVAARGNVIGPPLDAQIDGFVGAFTDAPDALEADISSATIAARKLPGDIDVSGALHAHLREPSTPGAIPDGTVSWRGVVARVTNSLSATMKDGVVDGALDAPDVSAESVRAFWAASPFDKPLRLHVEAKGPLSRIAIALRAGVGDASVKADGTVDAQGDLRAQATLDAEAPAGTAHATVDVAPDGTRRVLRFTMGARVAQLNRIPEVPATMRGSAALTARGALDLGAMTVEADTEGTVDAFALGPARVASASLDARVRGAVGAPDLDATVQARGLVVAGRRIGWASVSTRGSLHEASVRVAAQGPDIPNVAADARVQIGPGIAVRDARLAIARGKDAAVLTVPMATVIEDSVRVTGARIDGAGGAASATFETQGQTLRLRALSEGLDLGVIARIAGMESMVGGGVLAFDIDADLRRDRPTGRVALHLDRGSFGTARSVAGGIEVALDGRQVKGRIHAEAADVGSLDLETPKVVLPGEGALSAASWRRAWGDLTVDGRVDLSKLSQLVPPERLPFAQAGGKVSLKGHIGRTDAGDMTPDVQLSVSTQGLHLVPKVAAEKDIDGVWVVPYPPWHLDGMDFDIDAHVDGKTGRVDLATTARDREGAFAHLDADCVQFPWADALQAPERLAADLRTTAIEAHLHVPRRGLGGLPPMLRQDVVAGHIEADLRAAGTILAPRLDLKATVLDSVVGVALNPVPVEFDVAGSYDGHRGTVDLKARAQGREVLSSHVQGDVDAAAMVRGDAGAPWTASARAHFDALPLKAITALDDKLIAGNLTGDVSVEGMHKDAHARADLSIDALRVGSVAYRSGTVSLLADKGHLGAELRIDQGDGSLDAKVDAESTWGAAVAPALDEDRPLHGELASKNFRIAALLPFVDGVLDELDGRLDSDARIELEPRTRQVHLSGNVALTRGALEASAGGGEFHDIAADVSLTPDGAFVLKKLTASGMTGRLEATGSGRMVGLHLQSAKATVTIPKNAGVPVSAGGAEIGTVDGRIEVSADAAEAGGPLRLKVTVPSLRMTLPEASSADVQSLGTMPDVRIGAHRGNPATFVLLPAPKVDPPARASSGGVAVAVQLEDVEVVRGTDLKVDVGGNVDVASAAVTGRIQLKQGGTLAIQGRTFTVDSGTVTFVGSDASNPQVVVRAGYAAPDGTVVYATFVGPLKTGKVTLSSEPSLPKEEIVELLLFGTTGGPQAQSPSADPASSVVGTVGGEAAQPLNHALNQLGLGAVRADVDTSNSANPRPEIEIEIARDVSLKVAVVLGVVPPGVNPDHTLLTVAWRFLSRWSLASTLGDAGTTIFDLLWQRRY